MRTFLSSTTGPLAASLLVVAVAAATVASAADSARLITYENEGNSAYALSLSADVPQPRTPSTSVVVLFDTSASQTGAYRDAALAALESFLASLRPEDRVALAAVDLQFRALTDSFHIGDTEALTNAVSELKQVSPLGSTDLVVALDAAVEQLATADAEHRTIVYIGDGISTANLLDSQALGEVVERLRSQRVSVSSYAIGPKTDAQLLAVLANHSGGNLYAAEPLVWQDEDQDISDARAQEGKPTQCRGRGQATCKLDCSDRDVARGSRTRQPAGDHVSRRLSAAAVRPRHHLDRHYNRSAG